MSTTLVKSIINRAKLTLHETSSTGTRWTNEELLGWLSEGYPAVVQIKPDASSINDEHELVAGTRQEIPNNGLRLLDVVRNTNDLSDGEGITLEQRSVLDSSRRGWHREAETKNIEHYMFDEMDPRTFYVYPPAEAGSTIELVYSAVPQEHPNTHATSPTETIRLPDSYAPTLVDYILYRAYSKDADHSANVNRAMMHYQAFMEALGKKVRVDLGTSPNQPSQSRAV